MAELGSASIKDPHGMKCRIRRIAAKIKEKQLAAELNQPDLRLPKIKGLSHLETIAARTRTGERE